MLLVVQTTVNRARWGRRKALRETCEALEPPTSIPKQRYCDLEVQCDDNGSFAEFRPSKGRSSAMAAGPGRQANRT